MAFLLNTSKDLRGSLLILTALTVQIAHEEPVIFADERSALCSNPSGVITFCNFSLVTLPHKSLDPVTTFTDKADILLNSLH